MPKMRVYPPEWIDSAPTVAQSSVTIDADPSAIWAHIADHESWPTWFTDLKKVERIGSGAGVGSGRRVTVARITVDEEFTAWDEDEHFAFAMVKSPVPILVAMIESVRVDTSESGCTVTYRQGLQGRTGFGWSVKHVGKRLQGQTAAALANLKRIVEAEG